MLPKSLGGPAKPWANCLGKARLLPIQCHPPHQMNPDFPMNQLPYPTGLGRAAQVLTAFRVPMLFGVAFSLVVMASLAVAQEKKQSSWQVDGVERHGILYIPSKAKEIPTPLVFVFHGHGGSSRNAFNSFAMNQAWPEAISVHLQGLNTPGKLTDPEGKKPGWQSNAGDQGDRDLKLFDRVLENLKQEYKIDEDRIYSTGHSNGGGFTYLLWAERGDVFAAMGPSAAAGGRNLGKLQPKPLFHITSENDPLVKYEWQKAMIAKVRKLNGAGETQPWNENDHCQRYPASDGNDVVVYLHDGGHKFAGKDAVAAMVEFFKDHPRK
jgi:polyhydroxybutyrate depolymerase